RTAPRPAGTSPLSLHDALPISPPRANGAACGTRPGRMKYRRLGNSGLHVSAVSLGSWLTFGNTVDQAATDRIVAAARAQGINLRSEEHTSELQSRENLVCRLLL